MAPLSQHMCFAPLLKDHSGLSFTEHPIYMQVCLGVCSVPLVFCPVLVKMSSCPNHFSTTIHFILFIYILLDFINYLFILLLFKYSFLHFPPTTPANPAIPTSHP